MKLINDVNKPELPGIIESKKDIIDVKKMVQNLNKDLVDSGFDRYQYAVDIRGQEAYICKV